MNTNVECDKCGGEFVGGKAIITPTINEHPKARTSLLCAPCVVKWYGGVVDSARKLLEELR